VHQGQGCLRYARGHRYLSTENRCPAPWHSLEWVPTQFLDSFERAYPVRNARAPFFSRSGELRGWPPCAGCLSAQARRQSFSDGQACGWTESTRQLTRYVYTRQGSDSTDQADRSALPAETLVATVPHSGSNLVRWSDPARIPRMPPQNNRQATAPRWRPPSINSNR